MANTNFLQFDSQQQNMLNDTNYNGDAQRVSGVSEGIARSQLYNKQAFQASTMAKALADVIVEGGQNAMDNNLTALKQAIKLIFITAFGNNNFTGNNTFTGSVSLGSSATATTPSSSDNDTSVATSAFGQTLFANAIGTPRDVTVLWGDGSVVNTPGSLQLSEAFTNFEQIGILCCQDNGNFRTIRMISTYWLNYLLTQAPANNSIGLWSEGASLCSLYSYSSTINPSTDTYLGLSSENNGFIYVFGINRKKTIVPDPLSIGI